MHDSILGSTNIYTSPADMAKWQRNLLTGQVGPKAWAALEAAGHTVIHLPGEIRKNR